MDTINKHIMSTAKDTEAQAADKSMARDTILIIGATGSLGRSLVAELLHRSGVRKIRLLGRSCQSFAKAGYIDSDGKSIDNLHVVVCKDMSDRAQLLDEWFSDVSVVICVARPRSLKAGDGDSFHSMAVNISVAVCENHVPRFLLHGMPYVEGNSFGESPTMKILKETEEEVKTYFGAHLQSTLTVSRCCEMSEIGHLNEAVHLLGFFPCATGINPRLHPVTARDFASAVVSFVDDESYTAPEFLLVGGPRQMTWRGLGEAMAKVSQTKLSIITLPLFLYKFVLVWLGCVSLFPSMRGLYISMKLVLIPMATNTANDNFIFAGSDTVETYLLEQSTRGKKGWVHQRVFGSHVSRLPSPTTLARLVGLLATFDAITALFKPSFISNMQNLNIKAGGIDQYLVMGVGIASSIISVLTFTSTCTSYRKNTFQRHVTSKLLSFIIVAVSFLYYLFPASIFGFNVTLLEHKTLQHSRQAAMYILAAGTQMLALSFECRPETAVGMVCVVWCVFYTDLLMRGKVVDVFEMSEVARSVNLSFPIWSGILAIGILCR
jgi:uncharacterized protein YbjT (DUF2867 family)